MPLTGSREKQTGRILISFLDMNKNEKQLGNKHYNIEYLPFSGQDRILNR